MFNKIRFFLLPVLLLTTTPYSQTNNVQSSGLWGTCGVGASLATVHKLDINLKAGLSAQFSRFVTGYRYLRGQEIFQLWITPLEHINEHSFLFGGSVCQNQVVSLIVLAGPALIHGIQRDSIIQNRFLESTKYSTKKYITSGVSFELLFVYKMKRYIGFGTSLNANYNRVNSYIGLTGNVYFGRLYK